MKSNKTPLVIIFILIVSQMTIFSQLPNTSIKIDSQSSPTEYPGTNLIPKARSAKYTDELFSVNIIEVPLNTYSVGITDPANIIGNLNDLDMLITQTGTPDEHVLLKLESSIISSSLMIQGFNDIEGIATLLEVYGWVDPYSDPGEDIVNETHYDLDGFILLGEISDGNGDVLLEYSNVSIDYLLLTSSGSLGYETSLDSIEVNGFSSFIADDDNSGIPDIWEVPEINSSHISANLSLFDSTYEIMGIVGRAAEGITNHDFLFPFVQLGIIDETEILEEHFYLVCQVDLKLPFPTVYSYLQFLNSYDLINLTYIETTGILPDFEYEFGRFIGPDSRIRTFHVIDYTVDGFFDPMDYSATSGQILGSLDIVDCYSYTTKTAQEKFDLDASIVLDIVENVLDAVKGGKDLVEQFLKKIAGFIQGKIMDGAGKALLAKITKKALKSALKAILSILTIKDFIVKGIKILEKLGVTIPSWLKTALDFVDSIPFIDPPVEIWKIRLTFKNEATGLPILGYDYNNNITINTHPKGIYFGDTYSAQVIISSRDIFPVIGRMQSKNASRTITGRLYVEDFGLEEATMAKGSLMPDEHAQGRIYTTPPNGSIVISQCLINVTTNVPILVEADQGLTIQYKVTDENGTLLSDLSKTRAAINNLPDLKIDTPITLETDGSFTTEIIPADLHLDYHMAAILYQPDDMFHNWWNCTFLLEDTIAPIIQEIVALKDDGQNKIIITANINDYDLNRSSVIIKIIEDSTDEALAIPYIMNDTGTSFIFGSSLNNFNGNRLYYKIVATDNSNNLASSTLDYLDLSTPTTTSETTTTTITSNPSPGFNFLSTLILFGLIVISLRKSGRKKF